MPLSLYFRPSFGRSLKRLSHSQRETVSSLLEAQKLAPRFFYKKLHRTYYEAGVESHIRVVLTREADRCIAILAGNHDQIVRFLAEN